MKGAREILARDAEAEGVGLRGVTALYQRSVGWEGTSQII